MKYIKGIFSFMPGITRLFKSRKMTTAYLAVHWFLAFLLVRFGLEVSAMIGYGEPLVTNLLSFDIFLVGTLCLTAVGLFYYYFLINRTYQFVIKKT